MKKILIVLLFAIGMFQASAQKKEVATQEVTIDYLDRKAKECIGHNKMAVSQKVFLSKRTVSDGHLKRTATGIEFFVSYQTPGFTFFTNTSFNPKHIVSVTNTSKDNVSSESPIGTMEIRFVGKTAIFNNNGDSSTVDRTTFNFLQSDPGNAQRIINAFNHLRNLYKAEDSPFE